jgi:hypothetical protein
MGVIDEWAKGGLEEVILPSGLKIKGKLPLIQDMVLTKAADQQLIAAVIAISDKDVVDYDDAERETWVAWQRVQAAAFIREAYNPKTKRWEPAVVTPAMLANGVPPLDVDALEDIVLRRQTSAMVTARSRFTAGEISGDELARILVEEASGTIAAWSSFRPIAGGVDPGPDSGDVRDTPESPPAPRAVRRARARSGASRPPRGGASGVAAAG